MTIENIVMVVTVMLALLFLLLIGSGIKIIKQCNEKQIGLILIIDALLLLIPIILLLRC